MVQYCFNILPLLAPVEQLAGYESFECCLHVLLRHFPVLLLAAKNAIMQYCSITSKLSNKSKNNESYTSTPEQLMLKMGYDKLNSSTQGGKKKKPTLVLIIQTSATKPDILPCLSGYNIIRTDLTEENFHMMH